MAVNGEKNATERRIDDAEIPPIVILDSDEEEEENTEQVFEGFIKAVEPFLDRKEVLVLRVQFAALRPDFVGESSNFKELLRRKTNQVHKVNVYIHFNEILKEIKGLNSNKSGSAAQKEIQNGCHDDDDRQSKESGSQIGVDRIEAGKLKSEEVDLSGTSSLTQSKASNDCDLQIINVEPSCSSSGEFQPSSSTKQKVAKDEKHRLKLKRKNYIVKLETKLKHISKEIKRLSQAELSLEEMEHCDSSYIKESRLKNQFNQVWNRICELKGRPTNTGRVVEGEVKIKGTGFPSIDRAVKKFLVRKRGFPDIFDIRNITIRANKKHKLGLPPGVLQEIAAEVFTDIGNKLQRKRKKDYEYNFGCHLTDDYCPSTDPALESSSLLQKLEENKKASSAALDSIFRKYVHLGRVQVKTHVGNSDSCASNSSSSSDEVAVSNKRKRKNKQSASDDSENDHRKRIKLTNRNCDANSLSGFDTTTTESSGVSATITAEPTKHEHETSELMDKPTNNNYNQLVKTIMEKASATTGISETSTEMSEVEDRLENEMTDDVIEIIDNEEEITTSYDVAKNNEQESSKECDVTRLSNDDVKNHGCAMDIDCNNEVAESHMVQSSDSNEETSKNCGIDKNELNNANNQKIEKSTTCTPNGKPLNCKVLLESFPLGSSKLLSKIQELRTRQLSKFIPQQSTAPSSHVSETCHSNRKGKPYKYITPNNKHLVRVNGVSNGLDRNNDVHDQSNTNVTSIPIHTPNHWSHIAVPASPNSETFLPHSTSKQNSGRDIQQCPPKVVDTIILSDDDD